MILALNVKPWSVGVALDGFTEYGTALTIAKFSRWEWLRVAKYGDEMSGLDFCSKNYSFISLGHQRGYSKGSYHHQQAALWDLGYEFSYCVSTWMVGVTPERGYWTADIFRWHGAWKRESRRLYSKGLSAFAYRHMGNYAEYCLRNLVSASQKDNPPEPQASK